MLYTGVTGKISVKKGAGTKIDVAHMSGFTLDMKKDIIESVSYGSDYKEKIPSIKDWSASADGKVDFATDSGQKQLLDAFEDGSVIEATFSLTATTFFVGDAYIESLSIKSAADGAVELSIGMAGSGGITLTIPA
jgi:predicted secreted protein